MQHKYTIKKDRTTIKLDAPKNVVDFITSCCGLYDADNIEMKYCFAETEYITNVNFKTKIQLEGDKKINCEIMIINSLTRESKGMNIFRNENDINDHNMIG